MASVGSERRKQIMRAAESLFENRRFHEITLDEVAALAHVGKGTIYRYFEDKDDLFFQTATSGFDDLCSRIDRGVPSDSSFEARLSGACQQVIAFFRERRRLFRLMDAEQGRVQPGQPKLSELWQKKRQRMVAAIAAILEQGRKCGHVRGDLPLEVMATYLLGMLRTRARDLTHVPEEHRRLEVVLDLFLNGVDRRPPSDPSS
jgi:AcrR family transcriptional regulator